MRQTKSLLPASVSLYSRSLQIVVSPCWEMALHDVISAILAWLPGPVPRSVPPVLSPVSSRRTSASPHLSLTRHAELSLQCNFNRGLLSRLQSFLYVQASMLDWPPDCTHRCGSPSTGRPGRLHHAMNLRLPTRTVVSLRA